MKECGEIMYDGIIGLWEDEDYEDKLTFDEFKGGIIKVYNKINCLSKK